MPMTNPIVLDVISQNDPDGIESNTPPTPADYAQFNEWVAETYGRQALIDYRGFNWAKEYGTYE